MAATNVITTNGNTSLNTALGFLQVEAYNMGVSYVGTTQYLALSSARTWPITFANAVNCKGSFLWLLNTFTGATGNASTHCDKTVKLRLQEIIGTCTIDVSTDYVTKNSHGLLDGQEILFNTTGALPTGMAAGSIYYVINKTANTFQISSTRGGGAINLSGTQSGTHTLIANRVQRLLTATEVLNAADNTTSGVGVPFEWDTDGLGNPATSYPVDTTANKWQLNAVQGAGTGNWSVIGSLSTAPCYAAWGDTAVTFADNNTVIQKGDDILTIDKTATIKGVLGTGSTANAWALITTRSTDPTTANVCRVRWENPSAASYTLTIDGVICIGAHSGIQIGTEANPMTEANKAIIQYACSVGTNTGAMNPSGNVIASVSKASFQVHGEYQEYKHTTLASKINYKSGVTANIATSVFTWASNPLVDGEAIYFSTTGALPTGMTALTPYYVRDISGDTFKLSDTLGGVAITLSGTQSGTHSACSCLITNDTTGWAVGDTIFVGGGLTTVSGDYYAVRTISYISGALIVLSTVLASNRMAGAEAVNMSKGFGVKMIGGNSLNLTFGFCGMSNLFIEGCELDAAIGLITTSTNYTWSHEAVGARSKHVIRHNSCWNSFGTSGRYIMTAIGVPPDGVELSNNIAAKYGLFWQNGQCMYLPSGAGKSGEFLVDNNVQVYAGSSMGLASTSTQTIKPTITNNVIDGMWTNVYFGLLGSNTVFSNNKFISSMGSAGYGCLNIFGSIGLTGSNNSFQNNGLAIYFNTGNTISNKLTNTDFGSIYPNAQNVDFAEGILLGWHEDSPAGDASPTTTYINELMAGSSFKITDNNNVANADIKYIPYGILTRTGYGLSDTLVWNGTSFAAAASGEFGLKLKPTDSTNELIYEDNNGITLIGNNQNKLVTVSARVKINSANFYAGFHTNPTLCVTYDDGTEICDVAEDNTNGQLLIVNFTPTTTNEAITIRIAGATDATGTDAEFYFGEIDANAAEGVFVDTTTLSKWFDGEPLGTRRSIPKPGSVWNEQVSNFQTAGSFGEKENNDLTTDDFIGLSD